MTATHSDIASLEGLVSSLEDEELATTWMIISDWGKEFGYERIAHINLSGKNFIDGLRQIFILIATTEQGREIIEETQIYNRYSEPGYEQPISGWILTGNWNSIKERENPYEILDVTPTRFAKFLDQLGANTEWSDEWTSCDKCGGLVRTEPDSHYWEPSYSINEGEITCLKCKGENNEEV